jgi:hypothetical protein
LSHVGAHTSFGRAGGLALGAHTQAHAYTHTHTHTIQKLSSGSIRCLVTHTIPLSHVGVTYTNFGRVGGLTLGAHAQAHTHTHTGDTNLSSGSIRCLDTQIIPSSHVGVAQPSLGRAGGLPLGAHTHAHTSTHTHVRTIQNTAQEAYGCLDTHIIPLSRVWSRSQALIGRTRGRELAFQHVGVAQACWGAARRLHTELEYVRVAHRLALVGGELDLTFECKPTVYRMRHFKLGRG